MKGRVWKFGDNIDTDLIIPGRYLTIRDPKKLAKHLMEGIDPNFHKKIKKGDFIVAGKNFGCGSSREHAPLAMKGAGIGAVIAESFARIFYRNAINLGIPAIEAPNVSKKIKNNEVIEIDLKEGIIRKENGEIIKFKKLPEFMLKIIEKGGLIQYLKEKKK
ncbi:3-isopropylmalate dehydratase, small subunit [Methanothermus fervidus DSM 2088]|uniref:3-isopropylmalate dehydratase small subunit n=1 Tax=Methanothermus fervidus (strain ATCC 43054 / DSM 2088 / JCM 10308 / V24 S) TaxID=523846 RepID=E3GYK1_METFV|nr:3-isopropylmalate dehydratase small subunit [Methanothermus fervidus]ADP77383.1 3-isopropylmalate dehydratase, small subunit [Methanothermus fervidus DSM 2088]